MRLPNATGQWNWQVLSSMVPIGDIRAHPELPWNRTGLSWNNEITVEAMNYLDQVMTNAVGEWEWRWLSSMVPIRNIRAHPDLPWSRYGLSMNKDITPALMDELDQVMTNAVGEWNWYELSIHVPMDEIRARPDLLWSRYGLSMNKDITVEAMNHLNEVLTSATGEWNWYELSIHVPMDEIRARPDLPWNRYYLSKNKDITVEAMNHLNEVMTNATGEWDWWWLSSKVPMDEIRAMPDLPWDREGLASNPGVTVDDVVHLGVEDDIGYIVSMDEIKANPLWSWNKQRMSMNPSITVEMVAANPDD